MRRWYVLQTQLHREKSACFQLQNQGFLPYLPMYLKRRSHARKIDWVPAPMFPRYMFVNLDPQIEQWRAIRSTIGVSHFISHGNQPAPVPMGIVEDIMAREDERGLVDLNSGHGFQRGDIVEVTYGPFADQFGMFEGVDDRQRVFILLDIMGTVVKTRLPVQFVKAAS